MERSKLSEEQKRNMFRFLYLVKANQKIFTHPDSTERERLVSLLGAVITATTFGPEAYAGHEKEFMEMCKEMGNTLLIGTTDLGVFDQDEYLKLLEWAEEGFPSRVNQKLREELLRDEK